MINNLFHDTEIPRREIGILCLLLLLYFGGLTAVHYLVIQQFPNSADEHNYLFSATLLSQGQISAPAHPLQEFFSPFYILTYKGKIFSLFPPGWPLLLSAGVKAGVPGLVNPLLAAVTLAIWFVLARQWGGKLVAWLTILGMMFSPFYIFNSASFFSHPACFLLLSLTLAGLLISTKRENPWWAILAGFFAGWSFATRELTTMAFLMAPVFWVFYRQDRRWRFLLFFLLGFTPSIGLYLCYNAALTGQWFVPVRFLKPDEWLGFGPRNIRLFDYHEIRQHGPKEAFLYMIRNLGRLFIWTTPGLPLFAAWGWWNYKNQGWISTLAISACCLPLAYTLYAAEGAAHYGPRFYYESIGILSFLGALGIRNCIERLQKHQKRFIIAGLAILWILIALGQISWHIYSQSKSIYSRKTLYELTDNRKLHNAVVVIGAPSGDMTQGDLIRNLPFLEQSDVIYAWDLGEKNQKLLEMFPQRSFYYFAQDRNTGVYYLKSLRR